jgi:hypothetical protein
MDERRLHHADGVPRVQVTLGRGVRVGGVATIASSPNTNGDGNGDAAHPSR